MNASQPSIVQWVRAQRARLGAWVESPPIQRLVIGLIVLNAITLGLETSPEIVAGAGGLLGWVDRIALTVFTVEIGLKLVAQGRGFFRSPWNIFDALVVGIALVPASGPFAVLRALRVLRILRLASMMPRMRFVVEALLHAIPGLGAIGALLGLIFYVFAVVATSLFGASFPDWFGTLGKSLYTLFQVMTLESWSMGIARPVIAEYPWAWAFFIPFILSATFTMLNLFIAVIVNTMQTLDAQHAGAAGLTPVVDAGRAVEPALAEQMSGEIRQLREEIALLRQGLGEAARGVGTEMHADR
ncbi:ion transporter [Alkalisalibacterium limincola]|uniref:ion transporter n=1 Tax=Alkalisalibacterium limincola TaxID=2699169 RepID=UPI001C9CF005|nr:ion transporter [Alkalisalibacterium limincola]